MRIQHNIMAMNSYRNYTSNTSALAKNLEKLSSGYKINRAGDDAAGLAISEKMRAQITGLSQAQSNAKSGINLVQTAEGALTEVHDMLNRMVKLADQSANGTYDNDVDRANLQKEVAQLKSEIDRIADASNFNGIKLLDGSLSASGKADGAIGTTKVSFTLSGLETNAADVVDGTPNGTGNEIIAGTDAQITLQADKNANANSIDVGFDDATGNITIKLGSKAAATYTADQITQAVRNKAATYANGGTDNAEKISKAYASFTMTSSDISLKANAEDTTTALTFGDVDGQGSGLTLQIGDTSDSYNKLTVSVSDMHTAALGIAGVSVSTQAGAASAVDAIKEAINTVSSVRGDLGATQNRLEHTINNLSVMQENIQDAEATIRDVDVAEEMMAYTKNNILVQSAQAMLAQANQVPQGVLQLLQ